MVSTADISTGELPGKDELKYIDLNIKSTQSHPRLCAFFVDF